MTFACTWGSWRSSDRSTTRVELPSGSISGLVNYQSLDIDPTWGPISLTIPGPDGARGGLSALIVSDRCSVAPKTAISSFNNVRLLCGRPFRPFLYPQPTVCSLMCAHSRHSFSACLISRKLTRTPRSLLLSLQAARELEQQMNSGKKLPR